MASLIQSMSAAAQTLEDSAASIRSTSERVFGSGSEAQKLKVTSAWVRDQIPSLRRRLALAQQIEAQVRGFQPVVQIDEAKLSTVAPETAIALGAEAAKKLQEADGKPDSALIDEIASNQNDPYFAAGFAQNASPDDLAGIVLAISRQRPLGAVLPELEKWEKQYAVAISAIGTTIATATRNIGDLALPPDYALRWVNTITATPRHGEAAPGAGAAASVVLRYGNYSTAFLNTVSAKVYDYDRTLGDKALREWGQRSAPGQSRYSGPYLPDGSMGADPLANLLEALSHNPQAAQNFFDVGNPRAAKAPGLTIDDRPVNDRLKHLLQDRDWSTGSELGHALEAATTEWRDREAHGKVSANIAAQAFALIGERTGRKDNWTMPWGLRPSVAKVVASYMPDIFRMRGVATPTADPRSGSWVIDADDPAFPPGQPFGIKVDPALMDQIVATLGENESDIQIVTAGVIATQQVRMRYALEKSLHDNPNTAVMLMTGRTVPFISNASIESAGVLGWVVNTAYTGDAADEALQKKKAELLAKTLSVVTSLPILQIKTAAGAVGEWEKFAFEQSKDQAINAIGKVPAGTSSGVYGKMDEQSKQALRDGTLEAMLEAGYLTPDTFTAANNSVDGGTYEPPPLTAFHGHQATDGTWVADQPLRFDIASRSYTDWARRYGDNEWIMSNVNSPYNNQFPNIR